MELWRKSPRCCRPAPRYARFDSTHRYCEGPCEPPTDPNLRLQDVAEAIDRILDYAASHTLESFAVDRMTVG